jgi:Mrp family chromosome partitioning ATPase
VVARLVEAVILVVSGATERAALLRTKQAFDQAGARLLGFVMNRVDLSHPHYDYYRAYGYGGDAGEKVA